MEAIKMIGNQDKLWVNRGRFQAIILIFWAGAALAVLIPVTRFLRGAFPLFTVVWLVVPLLVVISTGDAQRVGFRRISWQMFLSTTILNLAALLLIALIFEPWSHSYQALVREALSGTPPDTTFAWLVRYQGLRAWGGLLLFSGLVTIFGEELFFRGWLLQGAVYAGIYSWLAIGLVGGWAAARTNSIWPSLASATLWNSILVAWVL
jgi:membrane protease YdiL (CAAX protease family)